MNQYYNISLTFKNKIIILKNTKWNQKNSKNKYNNKNLAYKKERLLFKNSWKINKMNYAKNIYLVIIMSNIRFFLKIRKNN